MHTRICAAVLVLGLCAPQATLARNTALNSAPAAGDFTMAQVLDYPYTSELAAAENADRIAWVRNLRGVRNIWIADGPAFRPRQITRSSEDDGQEITQLTFSPDGAHLLY